MGVVIRIIETGEVLNIFPKFALENKITSVFFTTEGSKAIPISFPITDNNTKIFGYSNRMDRAKKAIKNIPIIIQKGSYSRKGLLSINSSLNSESSYAASIAYNEAILYDLQSTLKLSKLPNLPVIEKSTDLLIADMYKLLTIDDVDNPLTLFQIYLKPVGSYKYNPFPGNEEIEWDYEVPFILNENRQEFGKVNLLIKDKITVVKDGKPLQISVDKGIGISPFVHAWYVIEQIAEHYGYQMGENPFRKDPQLRRLTLLNNVADAIVGNFLDYSQLMPDVTITEFFQFLWARFGAKVFIDGNTNTLNIKLLKDSINESDTTLLPISGKYNIDHATPKQLKLSAAKNLDLSETETDTYEEFCTKYNNIIGNFWYDYYAEGIGGIVLDPGRGLFFHAPMSRYGENGEQVQGIKAISSVHFDWDKKEEGLEYVEISSPDECLTASWSGDEGKFPYYALDFALKIAIMEIDRQIEQRDEANRLAVCWDMGQYYYPKANGDRGEEQGYKFGSIFPYLPDVAYPSYYYRDIEGNKFKYALIWIGKDGCFEHFWKDYDAILRHSNDNIKGKIDLQPFQLSTLDISKPYIVGGHKILLQDYSYITGNINVDKQEFNGFTIGLYEPYDLATEQAHPKPDPIKYKWALETNKQKKLDDTLAEVIRKFKENLKPLEEFISCEWTTIVDNDPPTMKGLSYYPPTEQQYENRENEKRGTSEHDMKASYTMKYREFIIDNSTGEGSGSYWDYHEYSITLDLQYNAYFIPAKR